MKRIALFILVAAVGVGATFAASTRHWQEQFKAAREAQLKRDFQNAAKILEDSAAEARELGMITSAENSSRLAQVYNQMERTEDALQVINTELQRIGPKPVPRQLQILRGLFLAQSSYIYLFLNKPELALTNAIAGKDALEIVAGSDHPQMFRLYNVIGQVYATRRNYPEAEKALEKAMRLAESRRIAVAMDADTGEMETYRERQVEDGVIQVANSLGHLYYEQAKYKEAEQTFRKGLKHAEVNVGKTSPLVARPLAGLACAEFKQGRRKDFERDVDRLCEVVDLRPGFHPSIMEPLWLDLAMQVNENNVEAARATARKIAKVCKAQSYNSQFLAEGAAVLCAAGDIVDWPKLMKVMSILRDGVRDEHIANDDYFTAMYAEVGKFATERERNEIAIEVFQELAKMQANASDKGTLMSALSKIAELQTASGKKADALVTYGKITQLLRAKYGDDSRVANALERDAALMKELGREDDAKVALADAAEVRKRGLAK